jgi:cytochrome c-type biogenesis protein CcmF
MMEYIGERLLPGQIGHFCTVLSFVAALLSMVSYTWAVSKGPSPAQSGWMRMGRVAFQVHAMALLGIIGTIFYILINKYYEYHYAWANVSDDLPFRYTFSAFWKEQQGSFLLWSFWHIVLGTILMRRSARWEAPVMVVFALAEVLIGSMLLGLYIGDVRIGASPFDLSRHVLTDPGAQAFFQHADYLTRFTGNGLNPLLQNYWMTIHPPTLFLGFASTLVPFAYAVAGLWTRDHKGWLKPALPWALFSGAILGLGILMGGVWAYEALSFGGYWAWDPVENTSLVPWLTLVAGIHTHLIARHTGYSIRGTYGFYLITFVLVLYSTYLTRSGILGDTSAHAFTEMGLGVQLVLFIGVFAALGLGLWIARMREVPGMKEDEPASAREFWMLIGAMVLLLSVVMITGATSLPVVNKITSFFNPDARKWALEDPVAHHNSFQLGVAIFIGLLSGTAQLLRYSERRWATYQRTFFTHLGIALAGATALTALNGYWLQMNGIVQHWVLLFAAMFTAVANLTYLFAALKGNLRLGASAVSHLGFGLLVLGILYTGLNKSFISSNAFAMEGLIEGADAASLNRNVLLLKEAPMPMRRGYQATYLRDTVAGQTRTFTVRFDQLDSLGNPEGSPFELAPNVMYNKGFTEIVASNPSTKHYWNRDIFTHVTSLPKAEMDRDFARQQEDSLQYDTYPARIGDTIYTKKNYIIVKNATKTPKHHDYAPQVGDLAFGLSLDVHALDDPRVMTAEPMMYLRPGQGAFSLTDQVNIHQLKFRLSEAAMERVLRTEDELVYQPIPMKAGGTYDYKGFTIRFDQVEKTIRHPAYQPMPDDIAIAGRLQVTAPDGRTGSAAPVYLIRNNRPFSLKDDIPGFGLHFRFENIDPQTETLTISAAKATDEQATVPIDIAEDMARSDYIVLEAIVFPGINLVWTGSLLMLLGLALGMYRRLSS